MERVGAFGEETFLRGFAAWGFLGRTAEAPVVETSLPGVRLVEDAAAPDGRLRLTVHSGVDAEMMTIFVQDDGPRLLAVNGRELPDGGLRFIEHWGVPEDGLVLDLAVAESGEALRFDVVEHLLRPEEILGHEVFARPPELAPNIRMSSDRAMIKTPVTVDPLSGRIILGPAP